ncbi:MAG TPA: hypothetical protein VJ123_01920 [Anaerolineales bacterium]|nr:hypothetical protein [Anaerolineales bacterium]
MRSVLATPRRFMPLVVLGLAALAIVFVPGPAVPSPSGERMIHVEATNFEFLPGVIRADPGERITLELSSNDVVHGLYLEKYDLSLTAEPGQPARLTFIADRSGSFRFRCSVTCGALHPFMIGILRVGPNWLLWRAIGLSLLAALAGALTLRPWPKSS